MRTTLKRGIGRGAAADGNGKPMLPPGALSPISVYQQPPPPRRSGTSLVLRALGWLALAVIVCAGGVAGGVYLYLHESVAAVAPKSVEVKQAIKRLNTPLPGQPATALVIGYDRRAGEAKGAPSRSDTLMLVRADPDAETISLLSFPRDLSVEIRCPGEATYVAKINAAYTDCGAQGALETVKTLTNLPINYLITVNFRGFRQIVDRLGGIWMDIDRRYFNDRGGPYGYAKINLQPGYQRMNGWKALDFVRFRHTDSDIHRNARQQQFVRALKDQIETSFSVTTLPKLVNAITRNVEVGQGGGRDVSAKTVLSYALLAYSLPPGHVFQSRIEGLEGFSDLTTAPENITRAVREFTHPDVESPQKATAVALGEKVKRKAPAARETTVAVLNGNGITGAAANAGYLLGQRGYQVVTPPNGVPADAPTYDYFRTQVYFDPRKAGAQLAARRVANLFGSADVNRVPGQIRRLANGAMLVTVVGQTFHGNLASAPVDQTPQKQQAAVAPGASAARDLLRERRDRIPYPILVPTVIERSSWIDREKPIRMYWLDEDRKHKTVRLTYRMGSNEYWGVQMTDWEDAPVLSGRNFVRNIGGRRYELYYNGPHLHMVVLRANGASYWVVNTLLDKLSNETMLAIAKGLRPLVKVKG
ncbi:MAG TPA: LCP family protein [Gaiellaceae bacterium]|jgi:LCP family protein required for cell wall assembly